MHKSKCNDKDCEHFCSDKSGHPNVHECGHYHQCNEMCEKKEYSIDCKGRCIFKLGHENNHDCGLENHHCKSLCYLNFKAKNCKLKCKLIYPHEGKEHNCGEQHLCMEECYLKGKTSGCKNFCILVYDHEGEHLCGEKHFCLEKCELFGICGEKCSLPYPHEGKIHSCGKAHRCKNECSMKNITRGCYEICKMEYGHQGEHNCGEKHFCNFECSLNNKSLGCKIKCSLEYPHEGKDHRCSGKHFCNNKCQFAEISKFCNKQCSLEYNHNGPCICNLQKIHICNQKCHNCNNECILNSGHEELCKCGECKCRKSCKYKDCSRNCQQNCKYKAGHPESDGHICNAKHLCNNECWLKNYSLKCEGYCASEINNHRNHICNIPIEKHGCNGICVHYNNSRNCKKQCSREVNHSGMHLCEININQHLCKKKCDLFNLSINCNQFCNLPFNHQGNHICGIKFNMHICKNKCSLFNYSRTGCEENCCLNAGHDGQCFCNKSKENHICNNKCLLNDKSRGCKLNCNLSVGHKGEHQCEVSKEEHICKGICFLKGKTRGKCYTQCCLPYGHYDFCICKKEVEHLCDKNCDLFNKSQNCKELCNKPYGHKDEHLCDQIEKHLCKEKCYYFEKCKGKCNEFCKLKYGHKKNCNCEIKNIDGHLCDKNCFYFMNSRGCNRDCSLKYGHKGSCKCNVKEEFHFCKEKCELCKTSECGHIFNHEENKSEMKCCKCKDQNCSLTGKKIHLCGNQHDCKEKCKADGWCIIEPFVQMEEKIYKNRQGEQINYKVKKTQEKYRNNCNEKIKENQSFHRDKHICKVIEHKCGYQCPQCEFYCTEAFGHLGLHNCFHGNIKNSYITVSDKGSIAKIYKDNKKYQFEEGEKAIIFFCDTYCREQGQGHIHQFISTDYNIVTNENVRFNKKRRIYECKCSYFWENILKFKMNFTTEDQKRFSLCNWKCKYSSHQIDEYCQLTLWHDPQTQIPNGVYGKWIYEGHVFKCSHPNGVYSIFLVDQSGSMESKSDRPTNKIIKNKLDNMLGSSIQAISNFCKIRSNQNFKDKCSLIGFNDEAKIILKDVEMNNSEMIINNCLSNLCPGKCTYFYKAFKESREILEKVDRNEFFPIIILLTDGFDHSFKKTKPFVEKVSIYIFIIILQIYR